MIMPLGFNIKNYDNMTGIVLIVILKV